MQIQPVPNDGSQGQIKPLCNYLFSLQNNPLPSIATMQINQKINQIRASGTAVIAQRTKELIAHGQDIIDLSEGQPYYNTPHDVIQAAADAAFAGHTTYTPIPGIPELRDAIASKINSQNNTCYSTDNIVVGCGGKQLVYNAMMVSLETFNEVIIPAPYWVSYPEIVKLAGGIPIIIKCSVANDFKITPKQLEEAITPNTRWLVINSPANPTGSVYSYQDLQQFAEILRNHPHVCILSDDIYEAIVFDHHKFWNLTTVAPDLSSRVLTISGVSKSYAMTGWRIGYCAGEIDFITAMIRLQGQSTTSPPTPSQYAALKAITGPQNILQKWQTEYQKSRDLFITLLRDNIGLDIHSPSGAFYLFIGCSRYIGHNSYNGKCIKTDHDFCNFLLEEALVSCIPGSEFGSEGYFRLCFSKPQSTLRKAAKRINDALSGLSNDAP